MYLKEQTPNDQKKSTTQSPAKTATKSVGVAAQSTQSATAIQRARLNPISLTAADVRQLQRTLGNRAVGRLLAQTAQHHDIVQKVQIQASQRPDVDVQRWWIRSGRSLFSYWQYKDFQDKHIAKTKEDAISRAKTYLKKNRFAPPVTVIYEGSLENAAQADSVDPPRPDYDWSLRVGVKAVKIWPGDPGQIEDITSVVLSGYNTPKHSQGFRMITHLSASW
jgi:hypothetical protein